MSGMRFPATMNIIGHQVNHIQISIEIYRHGFKIIPLIPTLLDLIFVLDIHSFDIFFIFSFSWLFRMPRSNHDHGTQEV